jgi:hypothetical protein
MGNRRAVTRARVGRRLVFMIASWKMKRSVGYYIRPLVEIGLRSEVHWGFFRNGRDLYATLHL